MVFPWAAAAAVGSSVASGAFSKHYAGKQAKDQRKRHKWVTARMGEVTRRRFDSAERLHEDAVVEIKRGAGTARREAGLAQSAALREARDLGAADSANAEQSIASRGLTSTTAYDAAKRSATSKTVERLSGVRRNFADLYANLALEESGALASAYRGMGNLQQSRYAAEMAIEDLNYSFWAGGGGGSPGLNLGGLGAATGDLLGAIPWGSMFGGGATDYMTDDFTGPPHQ